MTDLSIETEDMKEEKLLFGKAAFINPSPTKSYSNPWSPQNIDKMDVFDNKKFNELIQACRFFYRHDPITSTTLNKLVEIGINELIFDSDGLSENEMRIFEGIEDKLKEFAEAMALEYLISGLVVPEISYARVDKKYIKQLGVKKYETLVLPTSMWIRNPETVIINAVTIDSPSYFVKVDDELAEFIRSEGKYKDGTVDKEAYNKLVTLYPEFVRRVKNNETLIKLENDLIFRRKPQSDSAYPTPYLFPALESLKHKRNIRRMDYAIAARMIEAIQLFKLGNDEYPITEDNEDEFEYIKNQMYYRMGTSGVDVERVFQLFANHTLTIEWITPDVTALLDDAKYKDINQDIIFALGFPRILITGESERTGTSDPEFAMKSPEETMKNFRGKILSVLQRIVFEIADQNKLKAVPEIEFAPINLYAFKDFVAAIEKLYDSGNLSRESYSDIFGYSWDDEMDKKEEEQKVLKEKELGEFAPQPFSPQPNNPAQPTTQKPVAKPKPTTNSG